MRLHPLLDLVVGEVSALVNESLPVLIRGGIIEILGLEGRLINHFVTGIAAPDHVLLHKLHDLLLVHYTLHDTHSFWRGQERFLPVATTARSVTVRCAALVLFPLQ